MQTKGNIFGNSLDGEKEQNFETKTHFRDRAFDILNQQRFKILKYELFKFHTFCLLDDSLAISIKALEKLNIEKFIRIWSRKQLQHYMSCIT